MTKAEFCRALTAFCIDHGFEIAGTCRNEGIYGEITIYADAEEKNWHDWDRRKFNFEWDVD